MLFVKDLVFFETKKINTKNGKTICFTTLVDKDNYDKENFFTDINLDLSFKKGDKLKCTFDFSTYNGKNYMTLIGVKHG